MSSKSDLDSNTKEKPEKEPRLRKKKIITDLKNQMEFYFSSANLNKDRFMFSLCKDNTFVSIDIFLTKFNGIKRISDDMKLLIKAIKASSVLELSEDKTGVKRALPVEHKPNEMECTIYVENVPSHADHSWVRRIFSQYGDIDYISLPRFKQSNRPKGFCFIEFNNPSGAEQALKSFGNYELKPEELISIKTFEENNYLGYNQDGDESHASASSDQSSKRKYEGSEDESVKRIKTEVTESNEDSEKEKEINTPKKKKKKRKRNKKIDDEPELDTIALRVLSKAEWKKLRNQYLNLQKKNYIALKKQLNYQQYWGYDDYYQTKEEKPYIKPEEKEPEVKKNSKPEFIKGSIIKIIFENTPPNPKKLRETIREGGGDSVAYVETKMLEKLAYVRFNCAEGAKAYLQKGIYNMYILDGNEEKTYWEHVISSWEQGRGKKKYSTHSETSQFDVMRGKDKIVEKAFKKLPNAKHNTRILFDD